MTLLVCSRSGNTDHARLLLLWTLKRHFLPFSSCCYHSFLAGLSQRHAADSSCLLSEHRASGLRPSYHCLSDPQQQRRASLMPLFPPADRKAEGLRLRNAHCISTFFPQWIIFNRTKNLQIHDSMHILRAA